MRSDCGVVFFDLFFTLAAPHYLEGQREYDILGITQAEWERFSEDSEQYQARATGRLIDPCSIVSGILTKMGVRFSERERDGILRMREERFRRALTEIDPLILDVLTSIRRNGWRLGLISNADVIDVMYWKDSPLHDLFDDAVFSCQVGCMKPHAEIYRVALDRLNTQACRCFFMGDGGSDELFGAKQAGLSTILTEYLSVADEDRRRSLMKHADYRVRDFREIECILMK